MFPTVFSIGEFFLPTYGVLVTLGFLIGLWITGRLARRTGLDWEAVINLGVYSAIAGVIGAKLFMIGLDLGYYSRNPREIFSLSTLRAGGVFYGGLLLALGTAIVYTRRKGLPGLATADVFAPGLALGHAIGRLGCFAAGCCWGVECHRLWAVTFTNPLAHQLFGTPLDVPLHPTQLYESFSEAVIFTVLYRRIRRPHRTGEILGLYFVLYSLARFLVEFVRAHDQANPFHGPFSTMQWIALALLGAGVWLIARRQPKAAPVQ